MSLASLLIGIVQALGTEWGLFRHYWVLMKLLILGYVTRVRIYLRPTPVRARAETQTRMSSNPFRLRPCIGMLKNDLNHSRSANFPNKELA